MVRVGLIGVGKMGMSHLALLNAHPKVEVAGICDSQGYLLSFLKAQSDFETYKSHDKLLDRADLDAVLIATPTSTHVETAADAISRGIAVFVEKPLSLTTAQSTALSQAAIAKGVANQVGYHNRFLGTFAEARRLVRSGALGQIHHIDGKAFGQVVTKPKSGMTWRSKKSEGGGCLHDYASHVIDLMNWIVGRPEKVLGARLQSIHSESVEDAVYALLRYPDGMSGQLETNWSDEAYRKMSTSVTVYGTNGKVVVDRQECQVFLKPGQSFESYDEGWTTRYITDLQPHVDFYLRGEEYTAQIDSFIASVEANDTNPLNSFASAAETDWVIECIARAHELDG